MEFGGLILVGLTILFVTYVASKMDQKVSNVNENKEQSCPPHRWRYVDQPGMPETTYIRCDTCRKTPRQVSEGI